jgi:3-hydroxybutyryl-CoA dehydratase
MFELAVGQKAALTRVFVADEVDEFAALVGSDSGRRVPSALVGGLFSTLLGTRLPGRGTNWMKQTLRFREPARVGEVLTATVEIVRLRPDQRLVNLRTVCVAASGALICDGEALVLCKEMA